MCAQNSQRMLERSIARTFSLLWRFVRKYGAISTATIEDVCVRIDDDIFEQALV